MRVHQISIKFKYSGDKSVAKVRRNKDSLFPSPPVLCIVSVCEKKPERKKKRCTYGVSFLSTELLIYYSQGKTQGTTINKYYSLKTHIEHGMF